MVQPSSLSELTRAFSSETGSGSRQENATKTPSWSLRSDSFATETALIVLDKSQGLPQA
jgi:hypothetical protein